MGQPENTINEISKAIKSRDWVKIVLWLFYGLVIIVLIISHLNLDKRIKEVENKIQIVNKLIVNINNQSRVGSENLDNSVVVIEEVGGAVDNSQGKQEWITDNLDVDKEGYYCHNVKNFQFWGPWTKNSYPPNVNEIKIKFKIKPKNNKDYGNIPTVSIAYGEYIPKYNPDVLYRLNIFDDSLKSIRLYDSNNESVAQEWLDSAPEINKEIIIKLSPRTQGPSSRIVSLNPKIVYIPTDNPTESYEFTAKKQFNTSLPALDLEGGLEKQIGIGIRPSTCIKIESFTLIH